MTAAAAIAEATAKKEKRMFVAVELVVELVVERSGRERVAEMAERLLR
jgi:hypothetical protein